MPNFTLKLPEDLWRRMRERSDVNWAEVARNAFRRVLGSSSIPVIIDSLIDGLRKSEEWEKLLCLALKTELLDRQYVLANLEKVYPNQAVEILESVNALLKEKGVDTELSGYMNGRSIKDLMKDCLILHGVYDKFEEEIRGKLNKMDSEVKQAALLFSQYFISDPLSTQEAPMSVPVDGLNMALEILLNKTPVMDVIDRLASIGFVFRDRYMSKAYLYEEYRALEYSREIFRDLHREVEKKVVFGESMKPLLEWLFEGALDFRAIEIYREEEMKEEFRRKFKKSFDEILEQAIRNWIILINYWPHRSRAGKRKSMPAYWVYRLTPAAKRKLPQFLPRILRGSQ